MRCATNLRSLAHADFMYAADFDGVVSRDSGTGAGPGGGSVPSSFYLVLQDQHMNLTTGTWPNGTGGFESQYAVAYSKVKWLNCPAFPTSPWPVSYVVNAFDPQTLNHEIGFMKVAAIRQPSQICNFTEGNRNLPPDEFDVYDLWNVGHVAINQSTAVTAGSTVGRICSDDRHRGYINLSYFDGHVDNKKYKTGNNVSNITPAGDFGAPSN